MLPPVQLLVTILLCVFCVGVFLCLIFGCWFIVLELRIRGQRLRRFAPSPEGYYEAFLTDDGFIKPDDNVTLDVPYTYSPHISMAAATQNDSEPRSNDEVVLELYDKGLNLRSIEKATGISYRQIQKLVQEKRS